jgi:NADH-quinone oxidoreductase subunit L
MKLEALAWFILFLPLVATGLITLFTQRNRAVSATLSISAVCTSFVLSLALIKFGGWEAREVSVNWLAIGAFNVNFGLKLDALSLMMLLVVTGVGSVIHVFSYGYMRDDPGFSRFFACMSLFTFSMLGIVLATDFLQLFIAWELVGLSSYLLIGFWFEKPSAADAAKFFRHQP